jgi:phytanoyl-CoA hydroxylase
VNLQGNLVKKENNPMPIILTEEQTEFYKRNQYLHARGIIPRRLLELATQVTSEWVEELANSWVEQGLLKDKRADLDFWHRLAVIWNEAGKPRYIRSPRRDLVGPQMFEFLKHPVFLDVASDLLNTSEISVHGTFNARPKLHDQKWTDTPWHQDAQYYPDAEKAHVVSMWIPLQQVTEMNSCLQVAPGIYTDTLLQGVVGDTDFIGLRKEDARLLEGISIEMEPGDVLCFNQLLPHRALPNETDTVRWSMDIRYEATNNATESGKAQGFIARSGKRPDSVETYEQWIGKWADIPKGSY